MGADNSMRIISLGGRAGAEQRATVDHSQALSLSLGMKDSALTAAQQMISLMPLARTLWMYGPEDWDNRGHAVVSAGVLAGSAVSVIVREQGLANVSFACSESTASLWPRLIPVTDRLAASISVAADPEVKSRVARLLQSPPVKQAFRSLDENMSLVVDARSQVVLLEAGFIRSHGSSQGTVWRLTQNPISVDALHRLRPWYREALGTAAAFLRGMLAEAGEMAPAQRALALLVATGAITRCIPVPDAPRSGQGGIRSFVGRLLAGGNAKAPGTVLWTDPWGVWDTFKEMATQ